MPIQSPRPMLACALFTVFAFLSLPQAWADELDSIRYGEAARTFAAASIQQSTPQDGVVNVITGDNQTVGNRMRLGQNDVFYLKLKNPGEAAIGDLFTVFKRVRKVFHPGTGQYMGYLISRLAVVQVIQVDQELTTARALRAFGASAPGDPVVKFTMPTSDDAAAIPASSDVTGMVIELQADLEMTLVAQRNIVYLDRGSEDGLRPGDRMELIRYGGGLPPRNVGEAKVLSTQGQTSTALVTKSVSRILKGDRFQTKYRADVIPLSPAIPSMNTVPTEPSGSEDRIPVQNAGRETRYSLHDLTNKVHYESGEATIKPEGYQTLDRLVELVKEAPRDQLIRVEGHADNMEIGPSLKSIYPTNWDLSKARATGVLRYLVEKGGIDSARVSSIGYGDTKPVVSNATEAGRSKNRRVDIVLYSPESAQTLSEPAIKHSTASEGGYGVTGLGENEPASMSPPSAREGAVQPTGDEISIAVPAEKIPEVNGGDGQSLSPSSETPALP